MDLFQQTKQREEEKLRQQKSKLKELRSKVHEKDLQIFDNSKTEEPSEENIIQNRHLLNFNAGELQTVYYDENDLEVPKVTITVPPVEESTTVTDSSIGTTTTKNTITTTTKPTEEEIAKKTEREDFFRQLMTKKKPLLQRQKSNPTPVDITKEESIAKYIAAENDEDDLSSKE